MSLPLDTRSFIATFWQSSPNEPDPAAIVGGLIFSILLWVIFIPRGIKAAKEGGRSPHWMWFGIHPLGALIAYLILRYLAKGRVSGTRVEAETAILQAASSAGGILTFARAAQAARLPADQVQILLDKLVKLGMAETDITETGTYLYVFPGLGEEPSVQGKQLTQDHGIAQNSVRGSAGTPRLSEPTGTKDRLSEATEQQAPGKDPGARLEQLEKLKQQGFISDTEYAIKKAEILKDL